MLRRLREERGLSLRELGQITDIDHAYIYRLEIGAKESPSAEILAKLIRGLKANRRDAEIIRYLAEHSDTSPDLVSETLKDPSVTYEEFAGAAGAAFRGTRPDYRKLLDRVRRILKEEESSG
jgi:transcriptional regulator with XRE-family HTH domain